MGRILIEYNYRRSSSDGTDQGNVSVCLGWPLKLWHVVLSFNHMTGDVEVWARDWTVLGSGMLEKRINRQQGSSKKKKPSARSIKEEKESKLELYIKSWLQSKFADAVGCPHCLSLLSNFSFLRKIHWKYEHNPLWHQHWNTRKYYLSSYTQSDVSPWLSGTQVMKPLNSKHFLSLPTDRLSHLFRSSSVTLASFLLPHDTCFWHRREWRRTPN